MAISNAQGNICTSVCVARKLRRVGAWMSDMTHRSGGPNEQVIVFGSVSEFLYAMQKSTELRTAAAKFALDRMRESRLSGGYREAHNDLLAHNALETMR